MANTLMTKEQVASRRPQKEIERMWVVKWKSKVTGQSGRGQPIAIQAVAKAWVDEMNAKYPDIDHWAEQVRRAA